MNDSATKKLKDVAAEVRAEYDADILLYFGPVDRPHDDVLIDQCPIEKKHKNVLLFITTLGGNAHAAYRIARALQNNYGGAGEVLAYVNGVCASAGTLLVMGADRLILSPHAELGPIDVQLRKTDEVGERTSGLTPIQALQSLARESLNLFNYLFVGMRFDQAMGLHFPTSLGSRIAAEMTAGLIGRLYEQIDPLRVAEINRILNVASEYGKRIGNNLKEGALERLLLEYPAHDFVIDPREARELFVNIEEPKPCLENLSSLLKPFADNFIAAKEPRVCYLKEVDEPAHHEPPQNQPDSTPSPPSNGAPPAEAGAGGAPPAPVHKGRRTAAGRKQQKVPSGDSGVA